ncbi:MAG: hypothetical protein AB202_02500 [Parcubacteria bacterium C7867-007]|nr:MAG: hypothetical protein AB202_02500 [Parcubacteria bacterium C7867-007]
MLLFLLPLVLILVAARFAFQNRWWHAIPERRIIFLLSVVIVIMLYFMGFYWRFKPVTSEELMVFAAACFIGLIAVELWGVIRRVTPRLLRGIRARPQVLILVIVVGLHLIALLPGSDPSLISLMIGIDFVLLALYLIITRGLRIKPRGWP